jgi:hypothetical protein
MLYRNFLTLITKKKLYNHWLSQENKMEASTAAAWWGAICGSVAIIWDAIKWFSSGAHLKISLSTKMRVLSSVTGLNDTKNVMVTVRNVGDKPTTITHFLGYTFESKWKKFRKKPKDTFFITVGNESQIPFKIEPSATWMGLVDQDQVEKIAKEAPFLYLGVQHSLSDDPVLCLVEINEEN